MAGSDATSPCVGAQRATVVATLREIGVADAKLAAMIEARNKVDDDAAEREAEHGDDGGGRVVRTSALTGAGVDELIGALENALREYPFPRHRAS